MPPPSKNSSTINSGEPAGSSRISRLRTVQNTARAISTTWRSRRSDQRPTGYCNTIAPRITAPIILPTSATSRPMRCRYSGSSVYTAAIATPEPKQPITPVGVMRIRCCGISGSTRSTNGEMRGMITIGMTDKDASRPAIMKGAMSPSCVMAPSCTCPSMPEPYSAIMYSASRRPRIFGSPASSNQLSTTKNTPTQAQPLIRRSTNQAVGP